MLSQSYFYHETIKKYIIVMAHIFKDIHIQRLDSEGELIKDVTIPISYGQKTKLFYVLNSTKNRKYDRILPRIDFSLNSLVPDPTRQKNPIMNINKVDGDDINSTFSGVSYNFVFDVSLICKYLDDMYQALEQILTMFTPDYQNLKTIVIDSLDIEHNLKVILTGVETDVDQDIGEEEFRTCEANLTFELQGYLYKPVSTFGKIKKVEVDIANYDYQDKIWSTLTAELNDETGEIDEYSTDL